MNRKLLAAAVAGAIAPMTAQAVDISVSGHVNRMIRFADNGADSDIQHLDTTASRSRWRMQGEGDLGNGITAGAYIESSFASNNTGAADIGEDDIDIGDKQDIRHSYLYFSGDFGKVTLGHTGPAGNGAMWKSHSGAWAGAEYSSAEVASGVSLSRSDGSGTAGSVWSAFGSVNASRQDILRYDTPSIGPASLAVSIDNGDNWSFGASLSTDVGGGSVIGGILYNEDKFGISGGMAFAQGTSINLAYGTIDRAGEDSEDFYINVAHSVGSTSVSIDYRTVDEFKLGTDAQSIGLGLNHNLGSGADVYAGFHNFAVDDAGSDIDDVNVFHIGSRIKFN